MQITPIISTMYNPSFSSRSRVGQDNANKIYETPTAASKTKSSDIDAVGINRAFLLKKYDINLSQEKYVEPSSRTYDSFTGLRDKNYLLAALDAEMQYSQREDKPLSVAMFDMDNFKSVNELLGYEVGDLFIKEISKNLARIAKDNKVDLYRFGGEEFILIFDEQPDSKKTEIAREISNQINSNPTIQSYTRPYIKNAQLRLEKALFSTAKIHEIAELKTKRDTIEEVRKNLTSENAKNDPYLKNTISSLNLKINEKYRNLISKCLQKEQDEQAKNVLMTINSKLRSNIELLDTEETYLNEYLSSVYDKASEIYQTRKWISDFDKNGGFGLTCGVVNFEPEALEFKMPMDIVQHVGKVLKRGKNTKKGQVYFETVK